MLYISTRGRADAISFRDAVLAGLAPDGGLYMPESFPSISVSELASFAARPFPEIAATILSQYAGSEIGKSALLERAKRAYATFESDETVPLTPLEHGDHLLELYHGPTLAFKDVAMQFLAELYEWALEGSGRRKTIIGATSGDTGGAAIKAFADKDGVEIFMLHPKGRISDVQRRIMTTIAADNITNIAVEGTFDDCQAIVKTLFSDADFSADFDLGGVNSINWVRLAAQCAYYFSSAAKIAEPVNFVVPTGNFGDVFAGYAARRMGLETRKLCVAVNSNDIMRRAIRTGVYAPSGAVKTSSPSMDIQTASNFERLLFEASGRDAPAIHDLMSEFAARGSFTFPEIWRRKIERDFVAERASEDEVGAKMAQMRSECGMLVDPHSAVGLVVLEKLKKFGEIEGPSIVLSTAHPAKFPDAVKASTSEWPGLPARYKELMETPEHMESAPASAAAIIDVIRNCSRFTGKRSNP